MGSDIHMAAEVRKNGKWELVKDNVFKNSWYNPDSNSEYFRNMEPLTNVPYDDRCYNLFAILANVRNGRGFAGCKTGERFNPVSEPKGYPEDMCAELQADIYGDYDEDSYDESRPTCRMSTLPLG